MEEGNTFITWEGKVITVVTSTPNVQLGFGLRNYRKHFLTKAVSFIIWALCGSPEKINGIEDLTGVRHKDIMVEINPLYQQTYGKPILKSALTEAITSAVSRRWVKRIPDTDKNHKSSNFIYFPTRITITRYNGWRKYYWKGLEPQFAPTSFKKY